MKQSFRKTCFAVIWYFLCLILIIATSFYGYMIFSQDYKPQNRYQPLAQNIEKHVRVLSHDIGGRDTKNMKNLDITADYIKKEFEDIGYHVTYQSYEFMGRKVANIIARRKDALDEDIVVIGAHYDSYNELPGADDNASGVAGVIELARLLYADASSRNLEFVAFVNEEPPFFKGSFMGSRVYVKKAKAEKKSIKSAIVLEMIGYYDDRWFSQNYPVFVGFFYPNKGNFITVVGNSSSAQLTKEMTSFLKERSPLPTESIAAPSGLVMGMDFSDHASFWREGYPAVMLTDTAFFRNKNYHTPLDTYEKLDYERTSELIKGLEGFIALYAKKSTVNDLGQGLIKSR